VKLGRSALVAGRVAIGAATGTTVAAATVLSTRPGGHVTIAARSRLADVGASGALFGPRSVA
jgi:hypothetical protein